MSPILKWMDTVNTKIGEALVPEESLIAGLTDPDEDVKKGPKEFVLSSVYPNEEVRDKVVKYLRKDL